MLVVALVAVLFVLAAIVYSSSRARFFSHTAVQRVELPSEVVLSSGERLRLVYLSNEDIRTLIQHANDPSGTQQPAIFDSPKPFADIAPAYRNLPWRWLDVDVTLARISSDPGARTSGNSSVPRVFAHKSLNEGEHLPRYVTDDDIRVLRRGNGCADESTSCGQYSLDLSTMQPRVEQVSTNDIIGNSRR